MVFPCQMKGIQLSITRGSTEDKIFSLFSAINTGSGSDFIWKHFLYLPKYAQLKAHLDEPRWSFD